MNPDRRTSPALGFVGLLMLAASLLAASPWFGVDDRWPWQVVSDPAESLAVRGVVGLWLFTALWLVLMAFTPWSRVRSVVAIALGIVILIELEGDIGLPFDLLEMAALVGMGAGLLLSGRGAVRSGRTLLFASAIGLVLLLATRFEDSPAYVQPVSELQVLVDEVVGFFRGLEASAHADGVIPGALALVAAAGALLVAIGVRAPAFVGIVFVVLLAAVLSPPVIEIVRGIQADGFDLEALGRQSGQALRAGGIVAWMLPVFAASDLAAGRSPEDHAWEHAS